jgi:hypothetical protein
MTEQAYFSPEKLAKRWDLPSTEALRTWRNEGRGPGWVKMGRLVRYPLAEVERFEREAAVLGRRAASA